MNNPIFNLGNANKTFATPLPFNTEQLKAVGAVSTNLLSITTILGEGKVLPEYMELAQEKLFEAKLIVDMAISRGWNGGNKTY